MRTDISLSSISTSLPISPAETMTLVAALAGVAALVLKFVRRTKRRVITFNDIQKSTPKAWAQEDGSITYRHLPTAGQRVELTGEVVYVNPKDVWAPSDLEKGLRRVSEVRIDIQQELNPEMVPAFEVHQMRPLMPEPEPTPSEDAVLDEEAARMLAEKSEPQRAICTFPGCGKTFAKQYELNHHARYHQKSKPCPTPSCPESFSTMKDLNRHINSVHQTTKKYYCTVNMCKYSKVSGIGASFSRKDNWRRHMRDKHGKGDEGLSYNGDEMDVEE